MPKTRGKVAGLVSHQSVPILPQGEATTPQMSARRTPRSSSGLKLLGLKTSSSSIWSATSGGLAHREDFGPGFGSCSICGCKSLNRGCGDTKKIVCSQCWPAYIQGRLGLSFIGGVSIMSEGTVDDCHMSIGDYLDFSVAEEVAHSDHIPAAGFPQKPSVGSWLLPAPCTPLQKMAEAAKARQQKKEQKREKMEAGTTYTQGQHVDVLRSNGKWESAKVTGTLLTVTKSKPEGYLEIVYVARDGGKKQIHHSKLAAYVRPSKANRDIDESQLKEQPIKVKMSREDELSAQKLRVAFQEFDEGQLHEQGDTKENEGEVRVARNPEVVNDEGEETTVLTPRVAHIVDDCTTTCVDMELAEKKPSTNETKLEFEAEEGLESSLKLERTERVPGRAGKVASETSGSHSSSSKQASQASDVAPVGKISVLEAELMKQEEEAVALLAAVEEKAAAAASRIKHMEMTRSQLPGQMEMTRQFSPLSPSVLLPGISLDSVVAECSGGMSLGHGDSLSPTVEDKAALQAEINGLQRKLTSVLEHAIEDKEKAANARIRALEESLAAKESDHSKTATIVVALGLVAIGCWQLLRSR